MLIGHICLLRVSDITQICHEYIFQLHQIPCKFCYRDPLTQVKVPGYGVISCFLEPSAKGWYLYYGIGVLMGVNTIFMGLTLYTIYTFKKETRAIDSARSNNSQSLS